MALFAAPRRIIGDDGLPVAVKRVWLASGAAADGDAKAAYQLFRTSADGRLETEGGSGNAAALVPAGKPRVFLRTPGSDSLSEQACRDLAAARAKAPKALLVVKAPAGAGEDVEKVKVVLQVKEGLALVKDIAAAGLGKTLLSGAEEG